MNIPMAESIPYWDFAEIDSIRRVTGERASVLDSRQAPFLIPRAYALRCDTIKVYLKPTTFSSPVSEYNLQADL